MLRFCGCRRTWFATRDYEGLVVEEFQIDEFSVRQVDGASRGWAIGADAVDDLQLDTEDVDWRGGV